MNKTYLIPSICLAVMFGAVVPAVQAQWLTDGNIVCGADGDQGGPEIITDDAGGALVVWHDYRSANSDVYLQRIDVGGALRWAAGGLVICDEAGDQHQVSMVPDGSGGALLAWTDKRLGTSYNDIYAQSVDNDGDVQWPSIGRWINSGGADPSIIVDGTGGAYISWSEAATYPSSIAVQRLDNFGYRQWTDYTTAGTGNTSRLVLDDAGGVVAGWQQWYSASYRNYVRGQRIDDGGGLLWAGENVSPSYYCDFDAQLVSDGSGGAIWVYVQGPAIYAQRVDGTGAMPWGAAGVEVMPTHGTAELTRAVSDGAGGALVVAEIDDGNIYVNRILANGTRSWSATGVSVCTLPLYQGNPEIAPDGHGGAFIVWTDMRNYTANGADIYAQHVDAAGAPQWTADGVPICTAPRLQDGPRITATGAHSAIITWHDERNLTTTGRDVYAQAVHDDGSIGDPPIGLTATSPPPAPGAVPRDVNITVTFNAAPAHGTDWSSSVLAHGTLSGLHAGIFSYDSATRTVTLDPDADFAAGEVVTVSVLDGIQDAGGNSLEPFAWSFTTAARGVGGAFAMPTSYPAGTEPRGICAADFDGDLVLDLAVTSQFDNTVSVLAGAGDGSFFAPTAYPTGTGPFAILAADVDRDGDMDLVTTNPGANQVSVLRNSGTGTFAAPAHYAVGTNPQQTCVGDFNCDGHLDLATANNVTGGASVSLLFNNGDGTFAAAANRNAGYYLTSIAAGDLNGDGYPDLVCGSGAATDRISVLLNLGDGFFAPKLDTNPGAAITTVECTDLDRDGDLDLVATSSFGFSRTIYVLDNPGDAVFGSPVYYGGKGGVSRDVDGDGFPDLVYPGSDGAAVRLNDGAGAFGDEASFPTGFAPDLLCAADFDGDGALDVAMPLTSGNSVSVLLNHLSLSGVGADGIPARTRIGHNKPNPFNPSTRIVYTLHEPGHVRLTVYDARGAEVAVLVDENQSAREHAVSWEGRNGAGQRVSSGVYFCKLQAGGYEETMKMTLLK